jgi:hypothetical protein
LSYDRVQQCRILPTRVHGSDARSRRQSGEQGKYALDHPPHFDEVEIAAGLKQALPELPQRHPAVFHQAHPRVHELDRVTHRRQFFLRITRRGQRGHFGLDRLAQLEKIRQ